VVLAGERTLRVAPYGTSTAALRLRLPPQAAAALSPGAHPVHWQVGREAARGEPAEVVEAGSTFYVPR
jgi:hypothetical protein